MKKIIVISLFTFMVIGLLISGYIVNKVDTNSQSVENPAGAVYWVER